MTRSGCNGLFDLFCRASVEVKPFALCLLDCGWRLTLPPSPAPLFHIGVRGRGWIGWDGSTRYDFHPGSIAIVPAGLAHFLETETACSHERVIESVPDTRPPHRIVAGPGGATELAVACGVLHTQIGNSLEVFDRLPAPWVTDLSRHDQMHHLLGSLMDERESNRPDSPVLRGAIMTQLLVYALREADQGGMAAGSTSVSIEEPRLAAALRLLLEDPAAAHSVESLASIAYMSRSCFAQKFREAYGLSPMQLLRNVRMRHAASLLAGSTLPITAIARRIGFSSRSHFCRVFKSSYGQSPRDYRAAAG